MTFGVVARIHWQALRLAVRASLLPQTPSAHRGAFVMNRLEHPFVGAVADQAAHLRRGTRLVLGLLDSLGRRHRRHLPDGLTRRVGRPCVAHLRVATKRSSTTSWPRATSALPKPGWPATGRPPTCRPC
jgi:hypothetical protein